MSAALFIAFEGGEGSGKSTQARRLASELERSGHKAILTREPGGTPGAEAIRSLLLDAQGKEWGARAEALLFAAARSDHVEKIIRPALEAGRCVITDRFLDSSRAYQGGGGEIDDKAILALHSFGSQGLLPDLTILLDAPASILQKRVQARNKGRKDAIEQRNSAYHERVRAAFRRFADDNPQIRSIDGSGSEEEVAQQVWSAVAPLLHQVR